MKLTTNIVTKNPQFIMSESSLSEWQQAMDGGALSVKEFAKRFRKAIKDAYKNKRA